MNIELSPMQSNNQFYSKPMISNQRSAIQYNKTMILIFVLGPILVLSQLATRPFSARSDEYQFIFEPVPGGSAQSSTQYTTTVALPLTYTSTFSREVITAGFKIKHQYSINYQIAKVTPDSDSTQSVQLSTLTSLQLFKISFFLIFLVNGNNLVWSLPISRTMTSINTPILSGRQKWFQNNPSTFPDTSIIKVFWFIRDGKKTSMNNLNVMLKVDVLIESSTQFSCQAFANGALTYLSLVVLFINETQYALQNYNLFEHYPTFDQNNLLTASAFNPIPSFYASTTVGGFDENCILGFKDIRIGGSNSNSIRSYIFNATNTPVDGVENLLAGKPFHIENKWICFGSCPQGLFLNTATYVCQACSSNCLTCVSASQCVECNVTYALDPLDACQLCSSFLTNCLTCFNSSVCLTCVNTSYVLTITATCDTCSNLISNCLTCDNSTHCTACINDNYALLASNNTCEACSSLITNCINCSSESICTVCSGNDTYFLEVGGSVCSLCNSSISNCYQCQYNVSSVVVCTVCDTGHLYDSSLNECNLPVCQTWEYLNSTFMCQLCNISISNCTSCINESVCSTCQVGYFVSNSNTTCDLCTIPLCVACLNNSVCTTCLNNSYYINNLNTCWLCSVAMSNCLTCSGSLSNSTLVCDVCEDNYTMSLDSKACLNITCLDAVQYANLSDVLCYNCSSFISQCIECSGNLADSTLVCDVCSSTYGFMAGSPACHYCPNIIDNCLTCINQTLCTSCSNDTFAMSASNSSCDLCSLLIDNCLTCDSPDNCTSCLNDTYYLDFVNQSCPLCSSALTNCSTCLNSSFCTACDGGAQVFLHLNGTCLLCSDQVSFCLECSMLANTSMLCTLCDYGYGWQSSNESCVSCLSMTGDCLTCMNSSYCLMCVNNTFGLTSTSVCEPCGSTMINCLFCDNITYCTQCVNDTFYVSPTHITCLKCSVTQLNCETCASESICTSCVSIEFYVNAADVCSLCSEANPGCINCSVSGVFTCQLCQAAFYLDPGSSVCISCAVSISNCVNCSSSNSCEDCIEGYAFNNTVHCQLCSVIYPYCQSCTNFECLACMEGKHLEANSQLCACVIGWLVKDLCTTIFGCVEPVKYQDGSMGCLACNTSQFNYKPVDNLCVCTQGVLLQETCNIVPGCIISNGKTACTSCNLFQDYQLNPDSLGQCICKQLLEMNGTMCVDICGDGFLAKRIGDNCDDGNTIGGDGCSQNCQVETSYTCRNGSRTTPSNCVYSGIPITFEQRSTKRSEGLNQGVFKFNVFPPIVDIQRMNLSHFVTFTCNADHTLTEVYYQTGILVVVTDFTSDLEGRLCTATMSFDPSVILSSSFTLTFIALSENVQLTISKYLELYITLDSIFTLLAYTSLGIFVLGLSHKMIGAELLASTQLIYLSRSLYKKIPFLAESTSKLRVVTGYWLFQSEDYEEVLPPFTERVRLSPYFLESTFAVTSLVLLVLLFLYVCHVLEYFTEEDEEERRRRRNRRRKRSAWNRVQIALQIIYNFLLVPLTAGFVFVWLLSAYLNSRRFAVQAEGTFSAFLNSAGLLVAWVAIGIVLGVELVFWLRDSNKVEHSLGGLTNCKDWYIPLFLLRCFAVISVLVVFMNKYQVWQVGLILGVLSLYFIFILFSRPYKSCLDKIGVLFCEFSVCYSILLAILSYATQFSEEIVRILILILQGVLMTSSILSLIRIVIVYKGYISRYCCVKEQQNKSNKLQKEKENSRYEQYQIQEHVRNDLNPYSLEAQKLLKKPLRVHDSRLVLLNANNYLMKCSEESQSPRKLKGSPRKKKELTQTEEEQLRIKKQILKESFKKSRRMKYSVDLVEQ